MANLYIKVGLEGSTTNDQYRLKLNNQNALPMARLSALFPNSIGLRYRNPVTGLWIVMDNKDADGNLIPEHGETWDFNMVYVPLYSIVPIPAPRTQHANRDTTPPLAPERSKWHYIRALLLKATMGQPLYGCYCHRANDIAPCDSRGCSVGNNARCNDTYFTVSPYSCRNFHVGTSVDTNYLVGCNCPGYYSKATNNGYYDHMDGHLYFHYTTCSNFTIYNNHGTIDCCNFCCDRNDPYPPGVSGN